MAKKPKENVQVIEELVTEESLPQYLDKEYNIPYVLMFYGHKPQSPALSPYYPDAPRMHTSLLLCRVKEGRIAHVLNIDGYNFPSYVDPGSNTRIHQRLILQSSCSKVSGKTPLQKASWENMNCVFYALSFAQRILELFRKSSEEMEILMKDLSVLESEILEGMVGRYVNKSENNYFYDQELTVQHHNKLRQDLATGLLQEYTQPNVEEPMVATPIITAEPEPVNPTPAPIINPAPATIVNPTSGPILNSEPEPIVNAKPKTQSKAKPAESKALITNQEILSDIIQTLISNIGGKKYARKTSGLNSKKIKDLKAVQRELLKITTNLDVSQDTFQAYLRNVLDICAHKRHIIHFWRTPHSVKEYLTLLEENHIKFSHPLSATVSSVKRSGD